MEITDAEFQRLVKFMYDNFGINLAAKRVLVQGRLGNMLRERNFKNYSDYLDAVMNDTTGAEVTTILNKLTTNHTFFMREPEHYTFMNDVVLPYMKSVCKDHVLRIWSAACSSGEEVYTMAMLIDQFFGAEKAKWDTRILATDISQNVIGKAKTYLKELEGGSLKALPAKLPVEEHDQISFADVGADEVRERLLSLDLNTITPIEAMNLLFELQKKARG